MASRHFKRLCRSSRSVGAPAEQRACSPCSTRTPTMRGAICVDSKDHHSVHVHPDGRALRCDRRAADAAQDRQNSLYGFRVPRHSRIRRSGTMPMSSPAGVPSGSESASSPPASPLLRSRHQPSSLCNRMRRDLIGRRGCERAFELSTSQPDHKIVSPSLRLAAQASLRPLGLRIKWSGQRIVANRQRSSSTPLVSII